MKSVVLVHIHESEAVPVTSHKIYVPPLRRSLSEVILEGHERSGNGSGTKASARSTGKDSGGWRGAIVGTGGSDIGRGSSSGCGRGVGRSRGDSSRRDIAMPCTNVNILTPLPQD